jgi:2-amino-4-hydroxy-6-hydroxymethyldihydropteridine diphosphokinase
VTTVYIGLGSNLQQPLTQLRRAVAATATLPHSRLDAVSSAFRSRAVGPGTQPDYLNAVLRLDTDLPAAALLAALQAIEQNQGRVRTVRWGPRTLDLDILLYGEHSIDTPTLRVPHPAMHLRNFVLYPLAQIAGTNLVLPDGTELGTLIARCPRADLVDTALQLGTVQGSDREDL